MGNKLQVISINSRLTNVFTAVVQRINIFSENTFDILSCLHRFVLKFFKVALKI